MIIGKVNALLEPKVELRLAGPSGEILVVEALIDTGFNGALTLPRNQIEKIESSWRSTETEVLGDGVEEEFELFEATVLWDGNARRVSVHSTEITPLIGTSLLEGYSV